MELHILSLLFDFLCEIVIITLLLWTHGVTRTNEVLIKITEQAIRLCQTELHNSRGVAASKFSGCRGSFFSVRANFIAHVWYHWNEEGVWCPCSRITFSLQGWVKGFQTFGYIMNLSWMHAHALRPSHTPKNNQDSKSKFLRFLKNEHLYCVDPYRLARSFLMWKLKWKEKYRHDLKRLQHE